MTASPLERVRATEKPIRVAITGMGSIGTVLVNQCHLTPGFQPVVISDLDLSKAITLAERLGLEYQVTETAASIRDAIKTGILAVTTDSEMMVGADGYDVLIEATSSVWGGALHARHAISTGRHVVMMNFETELMFGPVLLDEAKAAGVVYTCSDGDQPTAIKRVVDDMTFWGFEPVMFGNMKGFQDTYTDPKKIEPEAAKRDLDPKMCSSYTDGSKLCVEMAVVANALGGRVSQPGMTGPRMDSIHDIFDHFDFAELWKAGDPPLVDYVLGAKPSGGVFAIGHTADEFQQHTLAWYPPDMGPGPFYLFYRPYHLGGIEALNCVLEAVLDGTTRLAPEQGMRAGVTCYAKCDLKAGDTLDGMGGFTTYGLIENFDERCADPGMPQLLCDGVKLMRDVRKDSRIALADCDVEMNRPDFQLWRQACGREKPA